MAKNEFKILLAEDDQNLGTLLVDYLEGEGYNVELCQDGELAWEAFKLRSFDLCLLDVMMPKFDGFQLAKYIRKKDQQIPIIFITAKFLKQDKLRGYNVGADDYIVKPFDEEELLWKIRAISRRNPSENVPQKNEVVHVGDYQFDFKNQSLIHNGDTRLITEKESDILNYLINHKNVVIKREDMLEELWGENDYFLGRSLDVFITKIRKYLKEDPDLCIKNVYGVGFIFNVPEECD